MSTETQPLHGLRVVELGDDVASAFAARLCAIYGADTIVVEPEAGHGIRHLPPWQSGGPDPAKSILFAYLGESKRSVTVNSADISDMRFLKDLLSSADAVINGYQPHRLSDLGIDLDQLAVDKPSIVITHVTPYGRTGPKSFWKMGALTGAAAGGQMYLAGDPDKPPMLTAGHQAHYQSGLQAFGATITALFGAKMSGVGDILDLSIQEVQAATLEGGGPAALWYGGEQVRTGNDARALWGIHPCADGWIGVASMPRQTNSVLEAMGHGDLTTDPVFANGGWAIEANELLSHLIPAYTAQHNAADIFANAANFRAPFSVIPTPKELLDWPHYKEIGFWKAIHHAEFGTYQVPAGPIQFGKSNRGLHKAPPMIGEHNQEVRDSLTPDSSRPSMISGAAMADVTLPYDGLRVVDMTQVWAGPYGGRFLADMGADVIKVEGPSFPDPIRTMTGELTSPGINLSSYFNEYNRGKRSLVLDFKQEDGMKALLALIATADVFIENWSSGVADRNGLGFDDLIKLNPQLVYISMPGFGHEGSDAERVGFGPTIEQMGGLVALQGYKDGPPHKSGISYGDPIAGSTCAAAVATALLERTRTGSGSYCLIPQRDGITGLVGEYMVAEQFDCQLPLRAGTDHLIFAPHNIYPAMPSADSRPVLGPDRQPVAYVTDCWLAISCRSDADWLRLVDLIDHPELRHDKYLRAADRQESKDEIDEIIRNWTATRHVEVMAELLQAEGIDASPVMSSLVLLNDEHLNERKMFIDVEHAVKGSHGTARPSWRFERRAILPKFSGPAFGQHSEEILEELGYNSAEIEAFRDSLITTDFITRA